MANSSRNVARRFSGASGTANAELIVSRKGGVVKVRLQSISAIPANTEILYSYGTLGTILTSSNKH